MSVEESLVKLVLFLAALHVPTVIAPRVRQSPIPFHIVFGALLGPPLANFAPVPRALALAGSLGLYLSVLQAGLETDFATARRDAPRALAVATVGLAVPFGLAVAIVYVWHARAAPDTDNDNPILSESTLRAALAAGAAVAPTSLGVVADLLATTPSAAALGTLVALAAVLDDVEALVLLAEVRALRSDVSAWALLRPLLASAGCVLAAALLAAALRPPLLARLARLSRGLRAPGFHAALCILLALAAAGVYAAAAAGSSGVLAAYATGLSFARGSDAETRAAWARGVAPVSRWLGPLFFAATIGFAVPLRALVDVSALAAGAAFACAAVLGKLVCGAVLAPRWVDGVAVGTAMLGRGEFGFLIAGAARADGLLSETELAAVTWGILVPTLLAPPLFVLVFRWRERRLEDAGELGGGGDGDGGGSGGGGDGDADDADEGYQVRPA